jgi:LysR family glycine cleavage system transcriptional activator
VTPTFASKWLIPRLAEFTQAHPDIELRIVASDKVANFQTDAVDLAVRYGEPPFGPGLNAELLFEHVIVAVASPVLVERLGDAGLPENLQRYPLLHDAHNFWPRYLENGVSRRRVGFTEKYALQPNFACHRCGNRRARAGAGKPLFRGKGNCRGSLVQALATELRVARTSTRFRCESRAILNPWRP